MNYQDAIAKTEAFLVERMLTSEQRAKGGKVTIYDYLSGSGNDHNFAAQELKKRPWCGVRVAEVSTWVPTGPTTGFGGSYMQVDQPWGIAVCGQVERCLLSLIEDWNEDEVMGSDEEFERLDYLLKSAEKE